MRRRKIVRANLPIQKEIVLGYLLMFPPLGFLGVHKFYLGQPLWGILYFFTGAFAGLGLIYDVLTMPAQVAMKNLLNQQNPEIARVEYIEEGHTHEKRVEDMTDEEVMEADIRYARKDVESLDSKIIKLAESSELNQLSIKDVIKLGVSLDDAQKALQRMSQAGVCEEVMVNGVKIYCF